MAAKEEEGHTGEVGEMAEAEELHASATNATSGGTNPFNVLKENNWSERSICCSDRRSGGTASGGRKCSRNRRCISFE